MRVPSLRGRVYDPDAVSDWPVVFIGLLSLASGILFGTIANSLGAGLLAIPLSFAVGGLSFDVIAPMVQWPRMRWRTLWEILQTFVFFPIDW